MTLPISEVVNVKLSNVPTAESQRNFGMLALLSSEYKNSQVKDEPYVIVATQDDVDLAFGTNSKTAAACRPFMSHTPRPSTLVIGPIDRTPKASASAPATKSTLTSGTITDFSAIQDLGADAQLTLLINGTLRTVIDLDFTDADDVAKTVAVLAPKFATYAVVSALVGKIVFTAVTAGFGSIDATPTEAAPSGKDSYLALMLSSGLGAVVVAGKDAIPSGAPEQTENEAIEAFTQVYPEWYAMTFVENILTDEAIFNTGIYIQSLDKRIMGLSTSKAGHLTPDGTNPFKKLFDALANRTCAVYHKSEPYAHMAALAEMLAVNFEGTKTVKTLKFKTATGVVSDNLDITTAKKAFALGLNVYTYYGSSPMFSEGTMIGKNRYFDEIHWLDWLVDAVQKNVFNALYQTPTQIDLTDAGTAKLLARVTEIAEKGVGNGGAAPGVWRIDGFGTLQRGDFLEEGYYAWADTVANLSDTDVENRKGPTMYLAIKRAGAVHKSEVIIGFSR